MCPFPYFSLSLSLSPSLSVCPSVVASQIIRLKQVDHIKSEVRILTSISHPYIVNLLGHLQDERRMYLLFEYVPGGELFSYLRRESRFPNDQARFYAAEIALAFEYLHSMNIVYRDLKVRGRRLGLLRRQMAGWLHRQRAAVVRYHEAVTVPLPEPLSNPTPPQRPRLHRVYPQPASPCERRATRPSALAFPPPSVPASSPVPCLHAAAREPAV